MTVCSDADPVWLGDVDPDGGIWSGPGIIDSDSGLFDPTLNGSRDYNETLRYTVNGCFAERMILVRETRVALDTAWFCVNDGKIPLDFDNTRRSPYNGSWTGPGVTVDSNPGIFDPALVGPGAYTLVYDANGCSDSIVCVVYGNPLLRIQHCVNFQIPFNSKLTEKVESGMV